MRFLADSIFLVLFFILGICWLVAWAAFHVAGGAIHILLVVAVIALIVHFARGSQAAELVLSSEILGLSLRTLHNRISSCAEGRTRSAGAA
jgi:hypothetical protein